MGNAGRNTCNEYLYNALLDAIESMEMDVGMKPIEDSCEEKTHHKCKCGYIFLTKYSDVTDLEINQIIVRDVDRRLIGVKLILSR